MLICKVMLAAFLVVVHGLSDTTFEATKCKIDMTCDEGFHLQGKIDSGPKAFQGRPGERGPTGIKGSKGDKGENCQCLLQEGKELTELAEKLEEYRKPACPLSKYYFPTIRQTTDYVRLKVPVRTITEISICAWLTPLPGKVVENGFFSYATPSQNNALLLWFKNGKFIPHLNGAIREIKLVIEKREHICVTINNGKVHVYVNGKFLSTINFSNVKAIEGGGGLVIGQEQDSVLGGYDPNQAFAGTVENVMVWYRILTGKEIADIRGNPCHCPKDYDIAFTPEVVQLNGGAIAKPVDTC